MQRLDELALLDDALQVLQAQLSEHLAISASRVGRWRFGSTHLPQPASVRRQRAEERCVGFVPNAMVGTGLLNDSGNARIVHVADLRKEMMLDLKIEPAQVPREKAAFLGEVHARFDLLHGPFTLHST